MTTYVIADIHGNALGLKQCLECSKFNSSDTLICLGDTCITEDSMIITDNGYKKINDICINDKVLTHLGRFRKVKRLFKRYISEDIINITLKNGKILKITKNHPVFTNNKFIRSELISKLDLLYMPINFRNPIEHIDLLQFCKDFAIEHGKYLYSKLDQIRSSNILRFFKLTDRNLRILGYFIGDGTRRFILRRGTVSFSFENNLKKSIILKDVIEFLEENGIKYFKYLKNNLYTIHINSKILASFFNEFYNVNNEKIIPKFLESVSSKQFLQILYGLIITDGCYDTKRIRFNNTSKELIDMVYDKSLECGMIPIKLLSRSKRTSTIMGKICNLKDYYEISYVNISCKELFDMFNIFKKFGNNEMGKLNYNNIEYKIKDINEVIYNGYVYNLEVEDDNSYICNSITLHNCDGYPEVKQCFDILLSIPNLIYIIGNHDVWIRDWFKTGSMPYIWTSQGGLASLKSYNYTFNQEHLTFLNKALPYYIDDKNRLFVHGGIKRNIPIEEQTENELMWDRTLIEYAVTKQFYSTRKTKIKHYDEIFVGHTCSQSFNTNLPIHALNVWGLDTGSGFDGFLTIMNVDTNEYWQSDNSADLYGPFQGRT